MESGKYRVVPVLGALPKKEKAALLAAWEQQWHDAKLADEASAAKAAQKRAGFFSPNYYMAA